MTLGGSDHPRIRGEHEANSLDGQTMAGSSPHTRGALPDAVGSPALDGIIPAYAGSTLPYTLTVEDLGDHPRIRGEHVFDNPAKDNVPGSSPHTRGAHPAESG